MTESIGTYMSSYIEDNRMPIITDRVGLISVLDFKLFVVSYLDKLYRQSVNK